MFAYERVEHAENGRQVDAELCGQGRSGTGGPAVPSVPLEPARAQTAASAALRSTNSPWCWRSSSASRFDSCTSLRVRASAVVAVTPSGLGVAVPSAGLAAARRAGIEALRDPPAGLRRIDGAVGPHGHPTGNIACNLGVRDAQILRTLLFCKGFWHFRLHTLGD
jgi:hypothetical protein